MFGDVIGLGELGKGEMYSVAPRTLTDILEIVQICEVLADGGKIYVCFRGISGDI